MPFNAVPGTPTHFGGVFGIREKLVQAAGQRGRVPRGDKPPGFTVHDNFGIASDRSGQRGQTRSHCFKQRR